MRCVDYKQLLIEIIEKSNDDDFFEFLYEFVIRIKHHWE